MNTSQLERVLNSDKVTRAVEFSIIPRDMFIRQQLKIPSICIYNTDKKSEPGSHWLAVIQLDASCIEYFDSYGLPPMYDDVKNKLQSASTRVLYNKIQLQGTNSSVCGQYCLTFLLLRLRGFSMDEIVQIFLQCEDTESRDHAVNEFINSQFHHCFDKTLDAHDFNFLLNTSSYLLPFDTKCQL